MNSALNTTRRQFLRLTPGAVALAALPSVLRAAAPIKPMSLGYSLYGMKMVPLADAFGACAEIGYRNVEVCMFPGFPGEPQRVSRAARKELRRQLDSLGLTVSSIMAKFRLTGDPAAQTGNLETLKAAAELGQGLSPDHPPLIQAQLGDGRPSQWDEFKHRMVARLGAWADTLAAYGTIAALGTHAGNAVNTPERLLWLYHQVDRPELALYFNHIHYALEGIPLEQSLPALIPYSRFLHLQDATGTADNKNYLLPGDPEGPTDFPRYFRLLAKYGYAAPVVVHISGKFSNAKGYAPIPVAQQCYRRMNQALRDAGIRTT